MNAKWARKKEILILSFASWSCFWWWQFISSYWAGTIVAQEQESGYTFLHISVTVTVACLDMFAIFGFKFNCSFIFWHQRFSLVRIYLHCIWHLVLQLSGWKNLERASICDCAEKSWPTHHERKWVYWIWIYCWDKTTTGYHQSHDFALDERPRT